MEKIAVYGDYDADGVTSTAMVYSYLETRGADVMFYIPQREGEGYGMNIAAVEHLASLGVTLIITVDNGISSIREVERAKALGVDVVVTDHHRPQETLPAAVAVVDAYRKDDESPCKDFSGAGIAFKLLMALEEGAGDLDDLLETYGDLAAIGTAETVHAATRASGPACALCSRIPALPGGSSRRRTWRSRWCRASMRPGAWARRSARCGF